MSQCQAEMYQCAEGHLFCAECATKNAETKLGEQRVVSVQQTLAHPTCSDCVTILLLPLNSSVVPNVPPRSALPHLDSHVEQSWTRSSHPSTIQLLPPAPGDAANADHNVEHHLHGHLRVSRSLPRNRTLPSPTPQIPLVVPSSQAGSRARTGRDTRSRDLSGVPVRRGH